MLSVVISTDCWYFFPIKLSTWKHSTPYWLLRAKRISHEHRGLCMFGRLISLVRWRIDQADGRNKTRFWMLARHPAADGNVTLIWQSVPSCGCALKKTFRADVATSFHQPPGNGQPLWKSPSNWDHWMEIWPEAVITHNRSDLNHLPTLYMYIYIYIYNI